jgi:signal transduction histidine kinase
MKALFKTITGWGVNEETSHEEAGHCRLTNALLYFLLLSSFIETAVCLSTGAYQAALLNLGAPVVFGTGLLLMRAGHTVAARLLVLTVSYVSTFALATILGPDAQFQIVILSASALSFAFFPLEKWKLLFFGLALSFISFVLLELTHYKPILGLTRSSLTYSQLLMVRVTTVSMVWLLVVGHLVYYMRGRRLTQERLISSAKMVALGQMAAGIAHEVNNPLFLIVGHAERLKNLVVEGSVPVSEVNAISEQIQTISMRIGAIVHGLQALSRDGSADPFIQIHLSSLLNLSLDYCRARIQSHGVELRISDIPEHWNVIGREAQLSEVFLNVLNNALDAVLELEERWIHVEANADPDYVRIAITDSGLGIPAALHHKIFDPFFTTKPVGKGTGLGLSVSRGIMNAHRGQLLYDEQSARTRFIIRIPRGKMGSI